MEETFIELITVNGCTIQSGYNGVKHIEYISNNHYNVHHDGDNNKVMTSYHNVETAHYYKRKGEGDESS